MQQKMLSGSLLFVVEVSFSFSFFFFTYERVIPLAILITTSVIAFFEFRGGEGWFGKRLT